MRKIYRPCAQCLDTQWKLPRRNAGMHLLRLQPCFRALLPNRRLLVCCLVPSVCSTASTDKGSMFGYVSHCHPKQVFRQIWQTILHAQHWKDCFPPAGYTLFSHALFFNPGFGPEKNVHPAMVASHSWDTRMAEFGSAATSPFAPLWLWTWTIGPVTVALGTWNSATSPLMPGCNGTMIALVPESTIA